MFLVFPLNDKPDWRRPPIFTLLLILINCIVFFGPQRADEKREDVAGSYYAQSTLPHIETPMYLRTLQQRSDAESRARAAWLESAIDAEAFEQILHVMERDKAFMAELPQRIPPTSPLYEHWKSDRRQYEKLRGEHFTEHWLSIPAELRPETALTAMFMHGSTSHLVGNMVFLFAFGYTVELTLGGLWFIVFYLLAGLSGDLLHLATHWGSTRGSLGASGAISGLMAMYAALYGRRKIRFFYQLLFYFDHVRAPALILLPAWFFNELIQYVLFKDSGVGYMAHAGGLLGGALMAFAYKRTHPDVKVPNGPIVPEDNFAADLARAKKLLEQLKIDEARQAYADLCRRRPDDLGLLAHYMGLAKLAPASEDFHRSAALVFALSGQDSETTRFIQETFTRYVRDAQPRPRLTPEQLIKLGLRFVRNDYITDAMTIEKMLSRLGPSSAGLSSLRLGLVDVLLKHGRRNEAHAYAAALQAGMPGSSEARLASDLLTG